MSLHSDYNCPKFVSTVINKIFLTESLTFTSITTVYFDFVLEIKTYSLSGAARVSSNPQLGKSKSYTTTGVATAFARCTLGDRGKTWLADR